MTGTQRMRDEAEERTELDEACGENECARSEQA
jgi:hypothetical protein